MIAKRILLRWLTILCLAVASLMGTAYAAEVPFTAWKTVYVYDYAKVLDYEAKHQMQKYSELLVEKTGTQLIVMTVQTTGDISIKQYAADVLRKWDDYGGDKNNSILLFVEAYGGKTHIEFGQETQKVFGEDKIAEMEKKYTPLVFHKEKFKDSIRQSYNAIYQETISAHQIEPGSWGQTSPQKIASSAPTQDIYVQDYANVIDAETERQMQKYSARLDDRTGAQIVIVTVDTTGDVPIEQYSLDLFRKWGIGDKEKNNGVLLLVAVKDRKSRIEVGYGLEGALNDAKTGAIQDNYMLPAFRQAKYSEGIWRGYAALFKETAKEYQIPIEELAGESRTREDQRPIELGWEEAVMAGVVILLMLIDMKVTGGRFTHIFIRILLFILSRGRSGFGGGRGGGGGSSRSW